MARRVRPARRRPGKVDVGASWISYSDMMAALLLVFVLVLCSSMYQYFIMMETKSAELDEQSTLLTTQSVQLETQKAQLDEQETRLADQQIILLAKEAELGGALTTIEVAQGLLDAQSIELEDQRKLVLAAQIALQDKEAALVLAQEALEGKQLEVDASAELLSAQQLKLDNLVGVRSKIIQELSAAFSTANLRASVDQNTGDIMLESAVFFEVGKDSVKEDGQKLLNEFIPVYLSVLLRAEYADYLGEIVIEGHTDTQGTYLMNLKLSQDRALSVATYCLEMPGLTESQRGELRKILTAKGRSFSSPVYRADGAIDMDASRRVEFKFRLKDSEMIDEIRGILTQ